MGVYWGWHPLQGVYLHNWGGGIHQCCIHYRGCTFIAGGVVQGMCPHEFYLGTCTCIFKKIKPRGVGVGVEYEGCEGARDVST